MVIHNTPTIRVSFFTSKAKLFAIAVRFDLNPPSVQNVKNVMRTKEGNRDVEYTLMSLPLYLVEELPRILDGLRQSVE